MPQLREYRVFVSHAWQYNSDYYTLVDWIENSPNLWAKNYSVPKHDPLDANNTPKLSAALTRQIGQANVIFAIAGMDAAYSGWIQYELDEAVRLQKNIVGIRPYGQQRTPEAISRVATEELYWQRANVVAAVRKYG